MFARALEGAAVQLAAVVAMDGKPSVFALMVPGLCSGSTAMIQMKGPSTIDWLKGLFADRKRHVSGVST